MKRRKNMISLCFLVVIAVLLVMGCAKTVGNSGGNSAQVNTVSTEPITLTIFDSTMSDSLMNTAVIEPIQKKYPFITIKVVKKGKGSNLQDLIASGSVPDIIMGDSSGDIPVYKDLNALYDMTPLIKKYNFDLSTIDSAVLQDEKAYTGDGGILVLPRSENVTTLYYNKDIFDKFGVPYPKDGMTWDDAIELAKKVTKIDGGVQYRGLDFANNILIPYNQLSLPVVDAKTMQATVNNDQWKYLFQTFKNIYDIPGNKPSPANYGGGSQLFLKDKTLAMFASTLMTGSLPDAVKGGLNWDQVTLPYFKEAPGRNIQMFTPFLGISQSSNYKDQAFLAIAQLLSQDAQVAEAQQGRPSVLSAQLVKTEYGTANDLYNGKNKDAPIKNKFAVPRPSITKYDPDEYNILRDKFKELVLNDKDIVSALREAEDAINKDIEAKKAQ